jgi:hypothetical protein
MTPSSAASMSPAVRGLSVVPRSRTGSFDFSMQMSLPPSPASAHGAMLPSQPPSPGGGRISGIFVPPPPPPQSLPPTPQTARLGHSAFALSDADAELEAPMATRRGASDSEDESGPAGSYERSGAIINQQMRALFDLDSASLPNASALIAIQAPARANAAATAALATAAGALAARPSTFVSRSSSDAPDSSLPSTVRAPIFEPPTHRANESEEDDLGNDVNAWLSNQ